MIGNPKQRIDIQKETGLKGKELTSHIKQCLQGGGLIRQLAFTEPTKSSKKKAVYLTVAKNMPLPLEAA